jgi:hypothetical protein
MLGITVGYLLGIFAGFDNNIQKVSVNGLSAIVGNHDMALRSWESREMLIKIKGSPVDVHGKFLSSRSEMTSIRRNITYQLIFLFWS